MVRNTTAAKLAAKPERKEGGSSKTDEKKANIIVAVRYHLALLAVKFQFTDRILADSVRPEAERERAEPHKILVRVMDEKVLVFDPSDEDPNQRRGMIGAFCYSNLVFACESVVRLIFSIALSATRNHSYSPLNFVATFSLPPSVLLLSCPEVYEAYSSHSYRGSTDRRPHFYCYDYSARSSTCKEPQIRL